MSTLQATGKVSRLLGHSAKEHTTENSEITCVQCVNDITLSAPYSSSP